MSEEITIRVTSMQVTVVPTKEGAFIATVSATLTGTTGRAVATQPQLAAREPEDAAPRLDERPMSDAQRRMLWRLAMQLGHDGGGAATFLKQRLGVRDIAEASKSQASRLISALEVESRTNGKDNGHGAT